MQIVEPHVFQGLQQDIAATKCDINLLIDAKNIKLDYNGEGTSLSITNEIGPKELTLYEYSSNKPISIQGSYLGHCVLNKFIVLFTHNPNAKTDFIYRIDTSTDSYFTKILFNGNLSEGQLGFNLDYPIQSIGMYESELIQKVYWTDNLNQPRMINIMDNSDQDDNTYKKYDFVQQLNLQENVSIIKNYGEGKFSHGVIQYIFTYYYKYGQETNIFYVSPLYYISFINRGASPEESCANSFTIRLNNLETRFDFVRIYSIHRTSLEGEPDVRRVTDISLTANDGTKLNSVSYTDTGREGNPVNAAEVMYLGGQTIAAKTIAQKDNVLFLGGLKLQRPAFNKNIKQNLSNILSSVDIDYQVGYRIVKLYASDNYYMNGLNATTFEDLNTKDILSDKIKNNGGIVACKEILDTLNQQNSFTKTVPTAGFKPQDYYRLGIQFQYKDGSWSEPIIIPSKHPRDDFSKKNPNSDYRGYDNGCFQILNSNNCWYEAIPNLVLKMTSSDNSLTKYLQELWNLGYRKIRPLVVYPNQNEQRTICQGIIGSTISPSQSENNNKKLIYPSWFYRPDTGPQKGTVYDNRGVWFKDPGTSKYHDIQWFVSPTKYFDQISQNYVYDANDTSYFTESMNYLAEIQGEGRVLQGKDANDYKESYFTINENFYTLNSPDIEHNTNFQYIDYTNLYISNWGYTVLDDTYVSYEIQTETPPIWSSAATIKNSFNTGCPGTFIGGFLYSDGYADDYGTDKDVRYGGKNYKGVKYRVFTWQGEGSLNNDNVRADGGAQSAKLKKKCFSNLHLGNSVFNNKGEFKLECDPVLYDSDQPTIVKIDNTIYTANIDTMLSPSSVQPAVALLTMEDTYKIGKNYYPKDSDFINVSDLPLNPVDSLNNITSRSAKIPLLFTWGDRDDSDTAESKYKDSGVYSTIKINGKYAMIDNAGNQTNLNFFQKPVRMKYKSSPHIVLKNSNGFDVTSNNIFQSRIPIVELFRKPKDDTIFGGVSEDAYMSSSWIPAGEAISIKEILGAKTKLVEDEYTYQNIPSLNIYYDYGDTWYQRYDFLKTYPYTFEDINQVTEIVSTQIETKINIEGRYDKNIGQMDNTTMHPTNFNLINDVYSQKDNFFGYTILREDYYENDSFPNQVTWSLIKNPGADIDTFTNITLAAVADADGTKGSIQDIVSWQDNLYCFQNKAISQLMFNNRVQIPTSDGTPIEISNNYKMEGIKVIYDNLGIDNFKNVAPTLGGVYFINSFNNDLYLMSSQAPQNITETKYMKTWYSNLVSGQWTKNNYTVQLYFDDINNELYTFTKNETLRYNAKIQQFTSFLSYDSIEGLCSASNKTFFIKDSKLYEAFKGLPNYFFGKYQDYKVSFVSRGVQQQDMSRIDKVFDTIHFRGDRWNNINKEELSYEQPFDYIRVSNEYQDTGEVLLSYQQGRPSNLKKKFRIWNITIPRDSIRKRDRIRNPWCKITLGSSPKYRNGNTDFIQLHDIEVTSFT